LKFFSFIESLSTQKISKKIFPQNFIQTKEQSAKKNQVKKSTALAEEMQFQK
jgi:hypothetical protein